MTGVVVVVVVLVGGWVVFATMMANLWIPGVIRAKRGPKEVLHLSVSPCQSGVALFCTTKFWKSMGF